MRLTLTRRCEYGIRILLYLAGSKSEARATAAEFATICDIPPGNVPPIVSQLRREGLLTCTPGRGGGCSLAVRPEDVSLLDIIQALEGTLDEERCLLDSRRCHGRDAECALHDTWLEAKSGVFGALARLSLAEAAERNERILNVNRLPMRIPLQSESR